MSANKPPIVLASSSKRRSMLLSMCGIPHMVRASGVREDKGALERPGRVVARNALRKAKAVASGLNSGLVIGADTVVYLDGKIIGKIGTRKGVKETLLALGERASKVYTGLSVIDASSGRRASRVVSTKIRLKRIEPGDLEAWLDRIGPYDRAGGFSIEGPGSILFPRIEGCYFNILGLPMSALSDLFEELGYKLLDFMKKRRRE